MSGSILIVGHSHIRCLMEAWNKRAGYEGEYDVEFVDLIWLERQEKLAGRQVGDAVKRRVRNPSPNYICQCVNGNFHNVLGIVENPVPFSVGEENYGSAPVGNGRWFIPSSVMMDVFQARFERACKAIESVFAAFPESTRLYLNPPPPVADWEHIKAYPGVFSDNIHLGPAPNDLKIRLYELQTAYFENVARVQAASFIRAAPETLTSDGFLRADYYNADPTHGNMRYGQVMLEEIFKNAQKFRRLTRVSESLT
ncbi:hypothetical protein SAMN05421774_11152 [Gemmobacter megaterium]|uniref:GDSL-like Lipase/Acylhydrolase family protein n=1 Tax=Gemmobacter megaterium TaxID=1086013 RepID=A0A1N7QHA5_9RHOB|nr:hypothetical protein [Gemmobacter megaterium]SIT22291.1 hypothetical protein SAMN05421774_11152 [Gemmobacter megaterium]